MLQSFLGFGRRRHGSIAQLEAMELKQWIDEQQRVLLLDVRTSAEFAREGYISGARLMPLTTLGARLAELPRETPIVCVCRNGNRSQAACEILARAGFSRLANLRDGVIGWRAAGLPVRP
jgi:rhodanese-related sulfurtransferase